MTINAGTDSDGNDYEIWKQDQPSSCGVASIWMARALVKQQCIDEDEWPLAWRVFHGAVSTSMKDAGGPRYPICFNPAAFPNNKSSMGSTFANAGINAMQVAKGLQNEGVKANAFGAAVLNPANLGPGKAVIALVLWRPANSGGHFVVAARQAANGRIVFLDPWDGQVNEQLNNGVYLARYGGVGDVVAVVNVWQ